MKFIAILVYFSLTVSYSIAQQSINWFYVFGQKSNVSLAGIASDTSGNVYVAGHYDGYLSVKELNIELHPGRASFVAKFNSQGKPLWVNCVQPTDQGNECRITSVAADKKGFVAVTGYFHNTLFNPVTKDTIRLPDDQQGIFVLLYNKDGEAIFMNTYSTSFARGGQGTSIAFDSKSHIYVSIRYGDYLKGKEVNVEAPVKTSDKHYFMIMKFDSGGALSWTKEFKSDVDHNSSLDHQRKLLIDNNDNLLYSGQFRGNIYFSETDSLSNDPYLQGTDSFIAKFDPDGNFLWAKHITGKLSQTITDFKIDSHNNIYLVGMYEGECILSEDIKILYKTDYEWKSGTSFFYVKLNEKGTLQTVRFHAEPEYYTYFYATALAVDTFSNCHIYGVFNKNVSLISDDNKQFNLSHKTDQFSNFSSTWTPSGNLINLQSDIRQIKGWAEINSVIESQNNLILGVICYGENHLLNKAENIYKLKPQYDFSQYCLIMSYLPAITEASANQERLSTPVSDTFFPDTSEISKTFKTPGQEIQFTLYPNPTAGELNLLVTKMPPSCIIDIFSTTGQILYSQSIIGLEGEKTISFNIESASPGMYYLRFSSGNSSKTFKILKVN